ncbi:hypothetical protein EV183_003124 [Coemansia sp. RSA 2336]|nr:hypothetical protein EV183_003124 [Coemansia sp. RSA 2336]
MAALDTDLDLNKLQRRQVEVLTQALGQFVSLKSTAEGWQPVSALNTVHSESVDGGDISVHISRKDMQTNGKTNSVYRMTASIPLDADVSKDTQGMFSAYLSELRDWQAVLESPGIRNLWNYFISSSSTLEMLDAHTRITRSELRSPIPGQTSEFAHSRDLLMVETSLVDPTTVLYVATSFPTTEDDPAYLRQQPGVKRVESALWAWCVELGTPADAISVPTQRAAINEPRTSTASAAVNGTARKLPRACVQVTCFLHLELKSWKSNNVLACRAATNLIPALVAYLRLRGAPPRLARIGPSLSLERTEWRQLSAAESVWEVAYSVVARGARRHTTSDGVINQPIIARILDLETTAETRATTTTTVSPPQHARKVSSLTTYLSSSFGRQQGEASALGTYTGGILRDGEEEALVAMRARLSGSILELVVDGSKWHGSNRHVDIRFSTHGFSSARQLFASIREMHSAAPELFTAQQLELTWEGFKQTHAGQDDELNSRRAREVERKLVDELAAVQLVRCFKIRSQKSSRKRYLLRILNPPIVHSNSDILSSDEDTSAVVEAGNDTTASKMYSVELSVSQSSEQDDSPGVRVNSMVIEAVPFTLDMGASTYKSEPQAASLSLRKHKRKASRSNILKQPKPSVPHSPLVAPQLDSASLLAATPCNRTPTPGYNGNAVSASVSRQESVSSQLTGMGEQSSRSEPLDSQPGESNGSLELQDIPFMRLRQANSVPAAKWVSMGTAASDAISISRAELWGGKEATIDLEESDSASETLMNGLILRAEALVEGWTIFDVAALISSLNLTKEVSGMWAESHEIEQIAANASVLRCASQGTWAVTARDAIVCRAWSMHARSSRLDIAECSVSLPSSQSVPPVQAANPVRAQVDLSAWVLDKSNLADAQTQPQQQQQQHVAGGQVNNGRLRSSSVATMSGSPAVDAEVENQRRKQHVVKITHYLKYSPRGWLTGSEGGAGMLRLGASMGIDPQKNEKLLNTLFPPIPPPGCKDALVSNITKLVKQLDEHGAPPTAVWSRNANVLNTDVSLNCVQFQYRMATWGSPQKWRGVSSGNSAVSSQHADRLRSDNLRSMSALPASFEDSEFVEAEFRIEHRVWAFGSWSADSAHIDIAIEPFHATSSVACFVDPDADPHATRVRVCHHRGQLLPRVEEGGDAMEMAWPTVHVAIVRKEGRKKHRAIAEPSVKAESSLTGARVASWSVPPRVVVNGVTARVRYLRRDINGRSFYARCLSIAAHEIKRLARSPPSVDGLFKERLPDPELPETEAVNVDQGRASKDTVRSVAASHIAIQNYLVQESLSADCRVARPNQFADIMKGEFARIRHEIEMLDPQSPRSRWTHLQQQDHGESRSYSASLMTAMDEGDGWSQQRNGEVSVFERLVADISEQIPVTVAESVLQGVSVMQVAQLLTQHRERQHWDRVLFGERRELEFIADEAHAAGGVSVEHSAIHVPLLFDRRDALVVAAAEQAAYLPARQRLRNWERRQEHDDSGRCDSTLGDYFEPTVTVVESSVPGSQPLSSVLRVQVPLYAVRIEPIDGFERARGCSYAYPSCRITVACCMDMLGTVPLPLRRSLSARVPEQHIAQLRQRLLQRPLEPWLEAPSRIRRPAPHTASECWVTGEVSEEDIDGQLTHFYRTFDSARVASECHDAVYMATVRLPSSSIPSDVTEGICSLRKARGDASATEVSAQVVPVVSDIIVDARRFPHGIDVRACMGSEHSAPMAAEHCDLDAIASGAWTMSAPTENGTRLAVYIFALGADHTAPLGPNKQPAVSSSCSQYLVRTVLLPAEDRRPATEQQLCTVSIRSAQYTHESAAAKLLADAAVQPPVFCNGQRLRVHRGRPARQALLLVLTSQNGLVAVCHECGMLGCRRVTGSRLDAYASDDAGSDCNGNLSVHSAGGLLVPPTAQSDRVTGGSTASVRGRVPSAADSAAHTGSAIAALPTAIRQRTGTRLAAYSRQPTSLPDSADKWSPDNSTRAPPSLARILLLAAFLPLRRLVIGHTRVGLLIQQKQHQQQQPARLVKSTLALVLVLATAYVCVRLGNAAANALL